MQRGQPGLVPDLRMPGRREGRQCPAYWDGPNIGSYWSLRRANPDTSKGKLMVESRIKRIRKKVFEVGAGSVDKLKERSVWSIQGSV